MACYGQTANFGFAPQSQFLNLFFFIEALLSKSESVNFSLIESVIYLFTYLSVQKYFSLTNQLIFTD